MRLRESGDWARVKSSRCVLGEGEVWWWRVVDFLVYLDGSASRGCGEYKPGEEVDVDALSE